jgi:predicted metalloprotease
MQAQQASTSKAEANALQVAVELQADCVAGVSANRSQQKNKCLDPGDADQALQIASSVGDDYLQKETQGSVVPDAFTYGTSAQRKRWFMNGFTPASFRLVTRFRRNPFRTQTATQDKVRTHNSK